MDENEDEYGTVPFGPGAGVIFSTEDKRYVGKLMGRDEDFVYLKASHVSTWFPAELSESVESVFGNIVDMMSEKRVRWIVAVHRLGNPLRPSVGSLRSLVYEYMVWEHLGSQEGTERFVEIAQPVAMGFPLMRVEHFQSLDDVVDGNVLSELDFPVNVEYDKDHGDKQ